MSKQLTRAEWEAKIAELRRDIIAKGYWPYPSVAKWDGFFAWELLHTDSAGNECWGRINLSKDQRKEMSWMIGTGYYSKLVRPKFT